MVIASMFGDSVEKLGENGSVSGSRTLNCRANVSFSERCPLTVELLNCKNGNFANENCPLWTGRPFGFGKVSVVLSLIRNGQYRLLVLESLLTRRLRTVTNFFLLNLAVADLCVGVFCVYQNLSLYLAESWTQGDFLCRMYHFVQSLSYTASVLILAVIAAERYLAVLHPIGSKHLLTRKRLHGTMAAVWTISAAFCAPRLAIAGTVTVPSESSHVTLCVLRRSVYNSELYDVFTFVACFLLPLVLMSILYCAVGTRLWRRNEETCPRNGTHIMVARGSSIACRDVLDVTKVTFGSDFELSPNNSISSFERTSIHVQFRRSAASTMISGRRKVVRLLVAVVLVFAGCHLPFHARKLWQHWSPSYRGGSASATRLTIASTLLMYANSGLNPVLYAFLSASFRRSMIQMLRCEGALCRLPPRLHGRVDIEVRLASGNTGPRGPKISQTLPVTKSRQDSGRQGTSKQIDHCLYRKMEQGREEESKEPMKTDPDYESGDNPTFPKKENTLGRTQEIVSSQEDVTPPPPVSDVLGRLTTTLHQLSAVTGHRERWNRYDGSYEAQSFFTNYDAQADRAQLQYSTRLRKPPNLLQAPLRVTNTRAVNFANICDEVSCRFYLWCEILSTLSVMRYPVDSCRILSLWNPVDLNYGVSPCQLSLYCVNREEQSGCGEFSSTSLHLGRHVVLVVSSRSWSSLIFHVAFWWRCWENQGRQTEDRRKDLEAMGSVIYIFGDWLQDSTAVSKPRPPSKMTMSL
ncbi:GPRNPR2 [Cordylochernes scorpioides]|uniref:GPRNPR2 n=1 Tax=Cordylochernes scorpioides TaxID=51811 RepID=A0ABY6LMR9_9ARAC|nr:GPRNPR2 [Cordylochernes scorpioides]